MRLEDQITLIEQDLENLKELANVSPADEGEVAALFDNIQALIKDYYKRNNK
jgi:hypothetical protein